MLQSASTLLAEAAGLQANIDALRGLTGGVLDLAVVSAAKYTLPG